MPDNEKFTIIATGNKSESGIANILIERSCVDRTGVFVYASKGMSETSFHFTAAEAADIAAAILHFLPSEPEPVKAPPKVLVDEARAQALAIATMIPGDWLADDVALFASFILDGAPAAPASVTERTYEGLEMVNFTDEDGDSVEIVRTYGDPEHAVCVSTHDNDVILSPADVDRLIGFLSDLRASQ